MPSWTGKYGSGRGGNTYAGRDVLLKRIGFNSYASYLASPLWKRIRAEVFKAKGRKCWLCDSAATQVHHRQYNKNTLNGKRIRHLFPLCDECHERVEFSGNQKRTIREAKREFRNLRSESKQKPPLISAANEVVVITGRAVRRPCYGQDRAAGERLPLCRMAMKLESAPPCGQAPVRAAQNVP